MGIHFTAVAEIYSSQYYFLILLTYNLGPHIVFLVTKIVFQDLLPSPQDHDHRLQLVSKLKIDRICIRTAVMCVTQDPACDTR
eukprot:SAG11_NODE_485_length_9035_cov_16.221352_7_plen_83_part_00